MTLKQAEKQAQADMLYEADYLIVLPINRGLMGLTLYLIEPAPYLSLYQTLYLKPDDDQIILAIFLEQPCNYTSWDLPLHFLDSKEWLPLTADELIQLNGKPWSTIQTYARGTYDIK